MNPRVAWTVNLVWAIKNKTVYILYSWWTIVKRNLDAIFKFSY